MKIGYPPYMSDNRAVEHNTEHRTSDRMVAGQKLDDVLLDEKRSIKVGSMTAKPDIIYSYDSLSTSPKI